jgi:hypothetical protein
MQESLQIAFRDCLIEANRALTLRGSSAAAASIFTLDAMRAYYRVIDCMDTLPLSREELAQLQSVADRLMTALRSLGQPV